jgi:folate-binding protein YgfZ
MQYQILQDRGVIKVNGPDAGKFLQGLTTNNINPDKARYNLILSPQGRYLCDFFVVPISQDEYLIDVITVAKERLQKKLQMYKMRSKVEICDVSDKYIAIYSSWQLGPLSFKDPRYLDLKYRSVIQKEQNSLLSGFIKTSNLYNQDKYEFAIPDGDIDMIAEKSLPPEYGIDFLSGISYTKGCYVGQEVMARAKYQGAVRKKIYQIIANADITKLPQGTEIQFNDAKIGLFCSAYGNKGIALIRQQENVVFNEASVAGIKIIIQPAVWYE